MEEESSDLLYALIDLTPEFNKFDRRLEARRKKGVLEEHRLQNLIDKERNKKRRAKLEIELKRVTEQADSKYFAFADSPPQLVTASEWLAIETGFDSGLIQKAAVHGFDGTRLDRQTQLDFRSLVDKLHALPIEKWQSMPWATTASAKLKLKPRAAASIPGSSEDWKFDYGEVTFKGVSFPLRGREYDVFRLLATSGKTTDVSIGDELDISPDNVRTYLSKAGRVIRAHFDILPDSKGRQPLCELTPIGKQNRRRLRSEALSPKSKKSRKSTASPKRIESKKSLTISKKKRPRNS